jgi:hypothetical protein
MEFDKKQLTYDILIRYLLKLGELESERRRAGDMNWSFQVYHICESLVQKNQQVLY